MHRLCAAGAIPSVVTEGKMTEGDRTPRAERFYVRPADADAAQALEDAIITWINEIRAKQGLPPLTEEQPGKDEE